MDTVKNARSGQIPSLKIASFVKIGYGLGGGGGGRGRLRVRSCPLFAHARGSTQHI